MFEVPHYHGIIKKVVVGFGTLFSNMKVPRANETGTVLQTINVPIAYGPKEKWNVRVDQDPTQVNHIYTTLPRMSFEITGYNYDPSRMVNKNNEIKAKVAGTASRLYSPVPYNLDISLYLLTKGTEDSLAVLEQILPLFAPDYNLNMMAVPEMNIRNDVPIILNSVSVQDDFEGEFATRRLVTHTFNFTAKVMLYGPIKNNGVIDHTETNLDTRTLGSGENVFVSEGNPATGEITLEQWTP
jgi:hypothetical protein